MKLEAFPEIDIHINPDFIRRNPGLKPEVLAKSILSSTWERPTLDSNCYLVGMGTTSKWTSPTSFSVSVEEITKPVEVVSKYAEVTLAKAEYYHGLDAKRRNINTPLRIALVEFPDKDAGLVLTKLVHAAEVLSAYNLEYCLINSTVYNPNDLLVDFIEFIADFHTKGLVHGDLHLGNIGFRFRDELPPAKILFDLETAYILNDVELSLKRSKVYPLSRVVGEKIEIFEHMAIEDLGMFLAYLTDRKFPIKTENLLTQAVKIYLSKRPFSQGMMVSDEFMKSLNKSYSRILRSLKRIDELA